MSDVIHKELVSSSPVASSHVVFDRPLILPDALIPEPSRGKHVRFRNLEAVLGENNKGVSLASILEPLFGVKEVSLALENAVG